MNYPDEIHWLSKLQSAKMICESWFFSGLKVVQLIWLKVNSLETIANHFPNLNARWLLTGEGPMIKNYLSQTSQIAPDKIEGSILYISSSAKADYPTQQVDENFLGEQPVMYVPNLGPGKHRAFEIEGNSMEPTFHNSDRIIGRYVPDPSQIRDGYVYIVIARKNVLIARLINRLHADNKIILSYDNKNEFRNAPLNRRDIKELWEARIH